MLGAGLGGLSAAYELVAAGHDVTILEARTRAGGRVLTLREAFPDGLYAEAGATRISDVNDWTLKYIERFGLSVEPFRRPGADVHFVAGRRIVARDGSSPDWPLELTADERRLGIAGMRARYLEPLLAEVGDAGAPEAPPISLRRFDDISYLALMRRQGASAAAAQLLSMGSTDNENHLISALHRLRANSWRARTRHWTKITGGNDQLPNAFAKALSARIHYGAPVTRIEHSSSAIRVIATRGGAPATFDADYLVSTIPFPVLRDIEIRPRFSEPMRQCIRTLDYSVTTKVFVQTRSRFWEPEGVSGFGVTDRPIQEIWNMSAGQPGSRGLLVAYMTGVNAVRASRMSSSAVGWAAREMDHLLPGTTATLEGGTMYAWGDDPWVKGSNPLFAPGQVIRMHTLLRRPEGRVYFAGDYASAWPGWMQGALESGNHVARAIDAAT